MLIVDQQRGVITRIGSTGYYDVDALSFRPADATLWARGIGLIRIDLATGAGTLVFRSTKDIQDLAWNSDGRTPYAAAGSACMCTTRARRS